MESLVLAGAGVDVEQIARFRVPGTTGNPLPMVLTDRECSLAQDRRDPAESLCAAFGLKEAFFKAVRCPFDPLDVEWNGPVDGTLVRVVIGASTLAELGFACAMARAFRYLDTCVVEVLVFRSAREGEGAWENG